MAYKITRHQTPDTYEDAEDLEPPSSAYTLVHTEEARNGQLICVWATDAERDDSIQEALEALREEVAGLDLVVKSGGSASRVIKSEGSTDA